MIPIHYRQEGMKMNTCSSRQPEEIKMTKCAAYSTHQPQSSGSMNMSKSH